MIDYDSLTKPDLVAQFILMCRGQGTMLPYTDYPIIQRWMGEAKDVEILLLALEEKLPPYYQRFKAGHRLPTLKGIEKSISRRIKELSIHE